MEIRYYHDPDTGLPHIYGHGVTEAEVEQVLRGPGEDLPGARGARMKLGLTAAGRYLQVIYVPDADPTSMFVVTGVRTSGEGQESIPATSPEEGKMNQQRFPPGWDEARVREVIAHYESQSEDEQFAEIEAALEGEGVTMIAVPTDLADEVRALIARKHSA